MKKTITIVLGLGLALSAAAYGALKIVKAYKELSNFNLPLMTEDPCAN